MLIISESLLKLKIIKDIKFFKCRFDFYYSVKFFIKIQKILHCKLIYYNFDKNKLKKRF